MYGAEHIASACADGQEMAQQGNPRNDLKAELEELARLLQDHLQQANDYETTATRALERLDIECKELQQVLETGTLSTAKLDELDRKIKDLDLQQDSDYEAGYKKAIRALETVGLDCERAQGFYSVFIFFSFSVCLCSSRRPRGTGLRTR